MPKCGKLMLLSVPVVLCGAFLALCVVVITTSVFTQCRQGQRNSLRDAYEIDLNRKFPETMNLLPGISASAEA